MLPLLKSRPRVLLLDDDPAMQRLMVILLKRAGCRVDVVSTGRQAIERIATTKYRALLLDVMTPTEGGLTVIRHLQESGSPALERVVLVTAAPESVLRSVPSGLPVIHKPVEAGELIRVVRGIVEAG